MPSDDAPETVGELDPDAELLRFSFSDVVHLPGGEDCPALHRDRQRREPDRKLAAQLFADTPICRDCRGCVEHATAEATLPTTAEVPSECS